MRCNRLEGLIWKYFIKSAANLLNYHFVTFGLFENTYYERRANTALITLKKNEDSRDKNISGSIEKN